jgi:hypothetical protein
MSDNINAGILITGYLIPHTLTHLLLKMAINNDYLSLKNEVLTFDVTNSDFNKRC